MQWLKDYRSEIENNLDIYTNKDLEIYKAMRYSLLGAGKRIRGVLVLEFAKAISGDYKKAMPFACAIEMIHAYSLVHDDLPCMDDDDLRRGKPTNHKVFGENMAVLAGDALLSIAFETMLSASEIEASKLIRMSGELAKASGADGMISGQVIDILSEGEEVSLEIVEKLQELKTGQLIKVAAMLGAIFASDDEHIILCAEKYGMYLGKAFQVKDDILDVEGDEKSLGKPIGSDIENKKSTFVTLLGIEKCKDLEKELTKKALYYLNQIPNNENLVQLTNFLLYRKF